jgi:hypothetical protein
MFGKALNEGHTQKQIRLMLGSCLTQALLLVMSLTWGLTLYRRYFFDTIAQWQL